MDTDDKFSVLSQGELNVTGRLVDASNATLYANVTHGEKNQVCIYKPVAGERPLWDFPDGTLANREYASFLISDFLQLDVVPLTVLRDGPFGPGMVQEWIEIDESIDLADFFSTNHPELRKMAFFDAIVNNTDRKIGHLLPSLDGSVFGCDHGVTFHSEDKLRTVLWQWAGMALSEDEKTKLKHLKNSLGKDLDLSQFITEEEVAALIKRIDSLLTTATMPIPNPDWPAVPWPAF